MNQMANPFSDFLFAITSLGSISISFIFTWGVVNISREGRHELFLPVLIIVAGLVMATSVINTEKSRPFHVKYLVIWLLWLAMWCFRVEMEQHEERVAVSSNYYRIAHTISYLGCWAWPKVNTSNTAVRAVYCVLMFLLMAVAEQGTSLPRDWIIFQQLFSFAFIYFFASFFTQTPELCGMWCLFFDYPVEMFGFAGLQILSYIMFTFISIPDYKEQ